ncbi:MAG: hypothetical protein JWQ07_1624 [Ramlibacter sp.]|nr:hypothetical protein [Ramlibacter sp.]
MNKFTSIAGAQFQGSRMSEGVIELGLTAAAAAFTATIWLSIAAWAITPDSPVNAAAASQANVTRITLPTVIIVGHRDSLESTPATTTAENTAAIPVTLKQ